MPYETPEDPAGKGVENVVDVSGGGHEEVLPVRTEEKRGDEGVARRPGELLEGEIDDWDGNEGPLG